MNSEPSSGTAGINELTHVTIYVEDVDEAIDWYTDSLGFALRADAQFDGGRWVTVSPREDSPVEIVLMEPDDDESDRVGAGTMWVVATDDCRATFEILRDRGVVFISPPEEVAWGVSAIFTDLYGNPFNLLQPA